MRLSFSDDHREIGDEFDRVLSAEATPERARLAIASDCGWDRTMWATLAELGWCGITIGARFGGLGLEPPTQCLMAESVGKYFAAIPFHNAAIAFADALNEIADIKTTAPFFPEVVAGRLIGGIISKTAWTTLSVEDRRASGSTNAVPDGAALTHVMTLVEDESTTRIIVIDLAGSTRSAADSLDRINLACSLTLLAAPVTILAEGPDVPRLWERIIARYAILLAFVQIGGAEAALAAARSYVVQRFAFGRPLGSFQAVKHGLADVLATIEIGRSNAWYAAASLGERGPNLIEAAAAARVSATLAYRQAARANIHYQGALGVTAEADGQLHYRKAQALGMVLGTPRHWREILIASAVARRDAGDGLVQAA